MTLVALKDRRNWCRVPKKTANRSHSPPGNDRLPSFLEKPGMAKFVKTLYCIAYGPINGSCRLKEL